MVALSWVLGLGVASLAVGQPDQRVEAVRAKMALVPAGSYVPFVAGTKAAALTPLAPPPSVRIDAFWLDQFPVTNADYLKFVTHRPEWRRSAVQRAFADYGYLLHWQGDAAVAPLDWPGPVTRVSWFAARAYCRSLGKRLPTVDEWEFAAADGGRQAAATNQQILEWYGVPTPKHLASVETMPANSYGVHALHGMAWEWTLDFGGLSVGSSSDNGSTADQRFVCGDSSGTSDPSNYPAYMRYAFRTSLKADYAIGNLGFRCAANAAPMTPTNGRQASRKASSPSLFNLDASWRDQNGQITKLAEFEGKPVVLAMFYANCQTVCPMTITALQRLERALAAPTHRQVHFVLVSFDSARDGPPELAEYMAKHHLAPERWTLLSGKDDDVRDLAAFLDIKYRQDAPESFAHTTGIFVFDQRGVLKNKQADLAANSASVLATLGELGENPAPKTN